MITTGNPQKASVSFQKKLRQRIHTGQKHIPAQNPLPDYYCLLQGQKVGDHHWKTPPKELQLDLRKPIINIKKLTGQKHIPAHNLGHQDYSQQNSWKPSAELDPLPNGARESQCIHFV
jgi:hypothetical protein